MAGGSAGGDGRRSVERRSQKVGRRRKPRVGRKVGPEGCSKAQAIEQQDGWPLDLTADIQSEVTLEGDAGRSADDASRQSIGKRG
jgi:hypothetical protein